MSDDQLIPPPGPDGAQYAPVPAQHGQEFAVQLPDDAYMHPYADDGGDMGIDIRRHLLAILRYKWLLVAALLVGGAGAYYAWNSTEVTYTAESALWIEVEGRQGTADIAPIRAGSLVESNQWIDLIRSYQVLEPVVLDQRLFVNAPREYAPAFANFALDEQFFPDAYELRVGETGRDFVLVNSAGALVQQGDFGVPIGENVGFIWQPAAGSFPPEAIVNFVVISARDAAQRLSSRLGARMDPGGTFLRLSLTGTDPNELAGTLNAVMDRHVTLAADLKRSKLDVRLDILEEQLDTVQVALAAAEQALEEFRIQTISLPSDQALPIAAGLAVTRDPVFNSFFQSRIQVDEVRRDRLRLQDAMDRFAEEGVRVETLELIPAAAANTELRQLLNELIDVESELRSLRVRYADDYPPIQVLLGRIRGLEGGSIPQAVSSLIDALERREREMEGYVAQAAEQLEQIPPRTIEEQRLERQVLSTENLYNDIRGRVETARLAAASSIPDVSILDEAAVPARPTSDQRLTLAAAILFGCLGAAMAGALLLDRMDARFRYAVDVSRGIGLDILGSIPRIESGRGEKSVINAAQALEAFRELRIHVGFAYGSAGPITLTVTSPSAGEGKSLISCNLAVAFAEVGKRTLLIDADTRRGDAHRLIGCERSPGLIDYLRERPGDDIIQSTDHENLDFIGSGSRGVSTPELLASPRMAYFMGTLKRSYDVIIVDSPPLASGGDPLILASLTGNLALVIRTGTTEKALTQAKLDQLSRLPLRVLGAILNDVSAQDSYHSYYASYLPGYHPVPDEGEDETSGAQLIADSSK